MIDSGTKTKYWIYIGGGSGSGLLLMVIVCLCVYCKCKKHSKLLARSTSKDKSNFDLENPNMMHTKVGAIQTDNISDCGQETVGIQRSERPSLRVKLHEPMSPGTTRLLTLMERHGADTKKYKRTLRSGSMDDSESSL